MGLTNAKVKTTAATADGHPSVAPGRKSRSQARYENVRHLDGPVRQSLESFSGSSLSGVWVHTGSKAAAAAESENARAFAQGNDIYFNKGQYDPSSVGGQELLAHEVAHTIQQQGGNTHIARKRTYAENIKTAFDPYNTAAGEEAQADSFASRFTRGLSAPLLSSTTTTTTAFKKKGAREELHLEEDLSDDSDLHLEDVATFPEACEEGSSKENAERCPLNDSQREHLRSFVMNRIQECKGAFFTACQQVRDEIPERDSQLALLLIGVLSTVTGNIVSRAAGSILQSVISSVKKSDFLVHAVGRSRINRAISSKMNSQIGKGVDLGTKELSKRDNQADAQNSFLDVLEKTTSKALNDFEYEGILAFDDVQLEGLRISFQDRVIQAADYLPAIKAKLAIFKGEVMAVGQKAATPLRVVKITDGERSRLALCHELDHGNRIDYLFKQWVSKGFGPAARNQQQETHKDQSGEPVELTIPAEQIRVGNQMVMGGIGMAPILKSDKASFNAWYVSG